MKAELVLWVYEKDRREDGTYPLFLRLYHAGVRKLIHTGYTLRPEQWNKNAGLVIKHPNTKWLNNYLASLKTHTLDIALELKTSNPNATVRQVVTRLKNPSGSYFHFGNDYIEQFNNNDQIGTYYRYQSHLRKFKRFLKEKEINFSEIDIELLRRYQTYMKVERSLKINSIHTELKSIRSIYRAAIREGHAEQSKYPFFNFQLKQERTKKEKLSVPEINRIRNLVIDKKKSKLLWDTRNLFLCGFNLMGVRFSDIVTATWKDVIDGFYTTTTIKTGQQIRIRIPKEAMKIINQYRSPKQKREDYIFPILNVTAGKNRYKQIAGACARVNKNLKILADLANINKRITSHSMRHSFVYRAQEMKVDPHTIQQMLGHSSFTTTQVYLQDLGNDELSTINEMIAGSSRKK